MTPPVVYPSWFLKADRRSVLTTNGSQTYRTTFEQVLLDDLFILPGASWQLPAAGPCKQLVILPIAGGALLTTAREREVPLIAGCIYTVPATDAPSLTLLNPFDKETVNLLLLSAPVAAAPDRSVGVEEFQLPLTAKNVLVAPENSLLPVQVGLYDSRVKDRLPVSNPQGVSLCYVLNGSFEIEERLVEHRDALLLWDTPTIEFEALSETAILLYVQVRA